MLAATLASMAPAAAYAQEYENTPVTISSEKVKVDGKVCYSHIVLERQTLFSISKAYNVSLEDIYKYNPSVKENGLKKNSILIIPCEDLATEEPEKKTEVKEEAQQVERIHVVKWFEDLDVIAEKYGVSVEAIMKANGLTGRKLARRQKLVIPSADFVPEETQEQVEDTGSETEAEEAAEEARFAMDIVRDWELDMPLVYDWEYIDEECRSAVVDTRMLTDCTKAFCETVDAAGYDSMVYFNPDQSRKQMHLEELVDYGFWLAMYSDHMTYEYKVDMWQYTCTGSVPGIDGNVDINLFFPYE